MRYRVLWTDLALTRVEEIADFIARERPGAARAFVERIFERVGMLTELPRVNTTITTGFRDLDLTSVLSKFMFEQFTDKVFKVFPVHGGEVFP